MTYKNNNVFLSQPTDDSESRQRIPALVWFYGLWVALATLSGWLDHSYIGTLASLFMLSGIVVTNCFFLTLSRTERDNDGMAQKLALYQTIMGIAWTSAYFFFARGAGDLVLGMYMTVLMFAVFHLTTWQVLLMCAGAVGSHALIMAVETLAMPTNVSPLADGIRFLVLLAICVWVYMFARQMGQLRGELHLRNEELENVVERVTRIAEEDELTKSFNRRHIMETLAREKSRTDRSGVPFAILLFDLDHFKTVNDRYGHLVGDQILTDFASRVKNELRGMDTVNATEHKKSFGRYGGEEFLAILPGTDASGAEYCAERIRSLIARHEFRDQYNVTVSVGVAQYNIGETVPQLLTRADDALYEAKRDGRNRVRLSFPPELRTTGTQPNLRVLK